MSAEMYDDELKYFLLLLDGAGINGTLRLSCQPRSVPSLNTSPDGYWCVLHRMVLCV